MSEATQTLPYLGNAFLHSYNARRANFMGAPIFTFTYQKGQTTDYNGKTYDVPDQLTAAGLSREIQNQNTLYLKNENEYDNTFSAQIEGEFTGVMFSASASSNIAFHGSLFTSTEEEYFVSMFVYQTYVAQRNSTSNCLDTQFEADLAALPSAIENNLQQFYDFFDLYGTHYLYKGNFGATMFMQTSSKKSVFKEITEKEFGASITAGIKGALASGSVTASTVIKNSQTLQKYENSLSLYFESLGGNFSSELAKFEESVPLQPVLLLSSFGALEPASFKPISLLTADTAKRAIINQALEAYMLEAEGADGLISQPEPFNADTMQTAKSDGLILSLLTANGSPARSEVAITTENPDGKQYTGASSMHYSASIRAYAPRSAALLPVARKSAYFYKLAKQSNDNTATTFLRLATKGNPLFGAPQPVTPGQTVKARSSGFLVLVISNTPSGSQGNLQVLKGRAADTMTLAGGISTFANTSNLQISGNTCCIPVLNKDYYQVQQNVSAGVTATCFFVPMQEVVTMFKAGQQRTPGMSYNAVNDGFLLVTMSAGNSDFGTSSVTVTPAGGGTALQTGSSVFSNAGLGINLPINSVLIPVAKNSTFQAAIDKNLPLGGNPVLSITWFEFLPGSKTLRTMASEQTLAKLQQQAPEPAEF